MDEHELDELRMKIDGRIKELNELQRLHQQETGQRYIVGGGYSVPSPKTKPSGLPPCELCGGETDFIGMEGDVVHTRCRWCHMDQEVPLEEVFPTATPKPQEPQAFTVQSLPSQRPKGTRRRNARPTYQAHKR